MAEANFQLPGHLNVTDGKVFENVKKWRREFEVYMVASAASGKGNALLLHCAGPQVLEIYDQFTLNTDVADQKDKPDEVLKSLKHTVTLERTRSSSRIGSGTSQRKNHLRNYFINVEDKFTVRHLAEYDILGICFIFTV